MTPDQATQAIDDMLTAFGLPAHVPFVGDLRPRIVRSLVAEYQKVGDAAFAQMMQRALSATRTLAQQPQAPTDPTVTPDGR